MREPPRQKDSQNLRTSHGEPGRARPRLRCDDSYGEFRSDARPSRHVSASWERTRSARCSVLSVLDVAQELPGDFDDDREVLNEVEAQRLPGELAVSGPDSDFTGRRPVESDLAGSRRATGRRRFQGCHRLQFAAGQKSQLPNPARACLGECLDGRVSGDHAGRNSPAKADTPHAMSVSTP